MVIFKLGDWFWVYVYKERFSKCMRSKLMSIGDGSFQIIERINNNTYK